MKHRVRIQSHCPGRKIARPGQRNAPSQASQPDFPSSQALAQDLQELLHPYWEMPIGMPDKRALLARLTPAFDDPVLQDLMTSLSQDAAYVEAYTQRLPGTSLLVTPAPESQVTWVPAAALASQLAMDAAVLAAVDGMAEPAMFAAWLNWSGKFQLELYLNSVATTHHPAPGDVQSRATPLDGHDLRQMLMTPMLQHLVPEQPEVALMMAQLWRVPYQQIGLGNPAAWLKEADRKRIDHAIGAVMVAQSRNEKRWKSCKRVCAAQGMVGLWPDEQDRVRQRLGGKEVF